MTIPVDDAQRRAARIAAVACVASFVTVVGVNFGIFMPMTGGGIDAAVAARNILAHETLFRAGIVGQLLHGVGVLVLSAALYVVLRPVNAHLALLATLGRLVYGSTWVLLGISLATALRLLTDADAARVFSPEQLPALVRLYTSGTDRYYVGLLFWSLGSALGAFLWLRSGWVPRPLAAFCILAGTWGAACTIAWFLDPGFPTIVNLWWFDMPMVVFELALSGLLLFRGLRT